MINVAGTLYTDASQVPNEIHFALLKPFKLSETILLENGKLLFWELHYFRIMAALRRMRYPIPLSFTLDYLQDEIIKTAQSNKHFQESAKAELILLEIQSAVSPTVSHIDFCIRTEQTSEVFSVHDDAEFVVDLYKDAYLLSGHLSNLSIMYEPLRHIAKAYAHENGFQDCFLLNEHKNLVETTKGIPYLIKGNQWSTPDLMSGCQNLVIRKAFHDWFQRKKTAITLTERAITPFELQAADGLWILSASSGFFNVSHYRKKSYGKNIGRQWIAGFCEEIKN